MKFTLSGVSVFIFVLVLCAAEGLRPVSPPVAKAAGVVIGATAVSSAFSLGAPGVFRQVHGQIEFMVPNSNLRWKCGQKAKIKMNAYAIGNFWGITNSKLTLYDAEYNKVSTIMQQKLKNWLKVERTLKIGRARHGYGEYVWKVPSNITTGMYTIEFESYNALDIHASRIKGRSERFVIKCEKRQKTVSEVQNESENHLLAEKFTNEDEEP
ncbi:hypothetical protein BKA69DRAFT_1123511 [Paraphysoderma sedebokerense]|nr:hypothetical protein BKA69DRAFT_1123511 [Paraphysoderma sedebokerense]